MNAEEKRIRTASNQAKRLRKLLRGPKTRAQRRAANTFLRPYGGARWLSDSKAVDWPENVARWRKTA